jgi:hypothetical protein
MGRRNPLRKWVASARRVKRTEKEAEWRGERRGEGGRVHTRGTGLTREDNQG